VGLIRGNVLLYRASVGMLARSSGSSFRAGLSVPTDEHVVKYGLFALPLCRFPPCMAWRAVTESVLLRQSVLALNALRCCVCL
jgi:hypothetical protein